MISLRISKYEEVKNGNGVSVSMVDSGSSAEKNGLEVRR